MNEAEIRNVLLKRILFIGEYIPESLVTDNRPKYILLGLPQDLIDAIVEITEKK